MLVFTLVVTTCINAQSCPHSQGGLTLFSSLANWNITGSDLTISRTLKVDKSPGVTLRSIIVASGGSLIFDNTLLNLDVEFIRVDAGGKFIAGSETCEINNKITITFFGSKTTANIIGTDPYDNTATGYKGFVAMSGAYVSIW